MSRASEAARAAERTSYALQALAAEGDHDGMWQLLRSLPPEQVTRAAYVLACDAVWTGAAEATGSIRAAWREGAATEADVDTASAEYRARRAATCRQLAADIANTEAQPDPDAYVRQTALERARRIAEGGDLA